MDCKKNITECEHICWCNNCKSPIVEGQKYFRFDFNAFRNNKRLNICHNCLIQIGELMKKDKKTFDKLAKLTPKERREKLKLTKFLGDK